MGGGVTISATPASKMNAFTVTAKFYEVKEDTVHYTRGYWSCGFGIAFPDDDDSHITIGSIAPSELDGFKIITLQDQGYYTIDKDDYDNSESSEWIALEASHKCVLHIKGKDYRLTTPYNGIYGTESDDVLSTLDIQDGEKIEVTFTLL